MSTEALTETVGRGRTRVWDALTALVSLVGLFDASYLTIEHLSGRSVRCMIVSGCDEVLQSTYATVAGHVPVAALGALAYFTVFSLATLALFGYAGARRLIAPLVAVMLSTQKHVIVRPLIDRVRMHGKSPKITCRSVPQI